MDIKIPSFTQSLKNAEKVYADMPNGMREVFSEILKSLRSRDDLTVVELADSWFIIEHESLSHFVQLQIEPRGANLDAVLIDPADDDRSYFMGRNVSVTTKLTEGNVDFSVQRILAIFWNA